MRFPYPTHEFRKICGLTTEQMAALEAQLAEPEMTFPVAEAELYLPGSGNRIPQWIDRFPELQAVPVIKIDRRAPPNRTRIPLVLLSKSPKRDGKTGTWTVEIQIAIAICYIDFSEVLEPGHFSMATSPRPVVGMYQTSVKVRDAIDAVLGIYAPARAGLLVPHCKACQRPGCDVVSCPEREDLG